MPHTLCARARAGCSSRSCSRCRSACSPRSGAARGSTRSRRVTSLSGIAMPMMLFAPLLLLVLLRRARLVAGPDRDRAARAAPAGDRGRHAPDGDALADDALLDGRGARRGLRAHRAREGPAGARVLFVHALRNALLPVITVAGLQFGSLLSGAIIIEKVFARPGPRHDAARRDHRAQLSGRAGPRARDRGDLRARQHRSSISRTASPIRGSGAR